MLTIQTFRSSRLVKHNGKAKNHKEKGADNKGRFQGNHFEIVKDGGHVALIQELLRNFPGKKILRLDRIIPKYQDYQKAGKMKHLAQGIEQDQYCNQQEELQFGSDLLEQEDQEITGSHRYHNSKCQIQQDCQAHFSEAFCFQAADKEIEEHDPQNI